MGACRDPVVVVTVAEPKEVVVVVFTVTGTSSPRRERSLAGQFLVLQLAVVVAVLAIVAVISLRQANVAFSQQSGTQMRGVAAYVANLSEVRDQLGSVETSAETADTIASRLAPSVERALSLSPADEIDIVSTDGTVLVSSDPLRIGEPAELGESTVLQRDDWTGELDGGSGRVVAAHAPVLYADPAGVETDRVGEFVGAVLVEQAYPSVWDRLTDASADLLLFLGVGTLLGVLGSFVVSRVVKRRTQGMGAGEIARLADHREALLHSIREGVVAVDRDGRVTMVNDSAMATLGLTADPVGHAVTELGLDPQAVLLLTGDSPVAEDALGLVGDKVVVFNRRAASSRGQGIGTVTTMRDRTELVSLQNQLSSNLSITDTLRAQTHEFSNQLHTISGLVQLGEYDEVTSLVGVLTRRRAALTDFVTQRVSDLAVAALLTAKSSVADERGVRLELTEDSALRALDVADSADLTTIVGNLVDNAVDACVGTDDARVTVSLQSGLRSVHLEVADNGPGVPEGLRDAVFVRGFSTKPEVLGGRGVGLPLVQLICQRRGGSIELHHRGGAVFSVHMPLSTSPVPAQEVGQA